MAIQASRRRRWTAHHAGLLGTIRADFPRGRRTSALRSRAPDDAHELLPKLAQPGDVTVSLWNPWCDLQQRDAGIKLGHLLMPGDERGQSGPLLGSMSLARQAVGCVLTTVALMRQPDVLGDIDQDVQPLQGSRTIGRPPHHTFSAQEAMALPMPSATASGKSHPFLATRSQSMARRVVRSLASPRLASIFSISDRV